MAFKSKLDFLPQAMQPWVLPAEDTVYFSSEAAVCHVSEDLK